MTALNITATLNVDQLRALIAEVTAAERITKQGLSTLSRELLAHVWEHGDVEPINELMGTDENGKFRLTPINWRTAALYFNQFVAFTNNFEKEVEKYAKKGTGNRVPLRFNKKSKAKFEAMGEKVEAWLADATNDIWSWSDDNVALDDKPKDFIKLAVTAVTNAIDEEKGGVNPFALLRALCDNVDGLEFEMIRQYADNPEIAGDEQEQEQQAA